MIEKRLGIWQIGNFTITLWNSFGFGFESTPAIWILDVGFLQFHN